VTRLARVERAAKGWRMSSTQLSNWVGVRYGDNIILGVMMIVEESLLEIKIGLAFIAASTESNLPL
jgi:hypothetical protein